MGRIDFETETMVVHQGYDLLGRPASEIAKSVEIHTPLRARIPGQVENSTVTVVVCATGEVTHTLKADGFDASEDGTGRGTPIIAFNANAQPDEMEFDEHLAANLTCSQRSGVAFMPARTFSADGGIDEIFAPREVCDALHTSSGHGNKAPLVLGVQSSQSVVLTTMCVRRLTPTECERLQAFPDGYTAVPVRGKPAADGPRYKALGNSMCVNVMHWIGREIDFVWRFF